MGSRQSALSLAVRRASKNILSRGNRISSRIGVEQGGEKVGSEILFGFSSQSGSLGSAGGLVGMVFKVLKVLQVFKILKVLRIQDVRLGHSTSIIPRFG